MDAVHWLVATSPSRVVVLTAPADPANVARGVTSPLGERVARALLSAAGFAGVVVVPELGSPSAGSPSAGSPSAGSPDAGSPSAGSPPVPESLELLAGDAVLVVGDGSARRGEKAPGHLDERAFDFDSSIEKALGSCSAAALADLSTVLGEELLAAGVPAFRVLGSLPGASAHSGVVDYSGDPLGVQYWIARWTCVP
ncbi:hypothetical protein [Nocardioides sp. JQ2195]|uniref:hypothetical protein n=1 Tax=Nocardioides sp. JQ2195 TaxID=2592334 RepID=UPI00197F53C9|nr:hypothetical protein [Nocardioides sp. JQ2195]